MTDIPKRPEPEPKLTDAEVAAMLARLKRHFRQPVMPVSHYCDALKAWARVAGDHACPREEIEGVFRAIRKSNLLWRLIYLGEPLRTIPCPTHKGKWSGCTWDLCPDGCSSGHDVTGWLPGVLTTDAPSGRERA